MSSRYSICASASQLEKRFSIEVHEAYGQHYNAAPGNLLPVITNTGPQGLSFFYWGLAPKWAKNKPISEKIYNIKSEALTEKPSLQKRLSKNRCLVPADGFYEWKKVGKKTEIPYRYTLADKSIFAFAALWEEYEDEGESFHTFSLITVPAPEHLLPTSERMAVILHPDAEKKWLSNDVGNGALISALTLPKDLQLDSYPISPRINVLSANDPTLILPTAPTDQFGNLTLFDF